MTDQSGEISEKVACYLCNSVSIAVSSNRRSISFHKIHNYYKCGRCKSYSLFPKLENHEIDELYSTKYIEDVNPDFNMNEQVNVSRYLNLQETLKKVENHKSKSFLDYGCGATAEAIILASNFGFNTFGVEIEADTRQVAQLKGNCQIFSPDEALASGAKFDIIFLGDVLEHLCEPLLVLNQVKTLLSPNGFLIIQGPLEGATTICNTLLSVKARLLSKFPSNFPPYHLSLATKESIVKALKINGLIIQKLEVTEPLWPAPKFGSRSSLVSITALIFSFAKILDMATSKIIKHYGTRFFLTATKQ
jgi:2-polyprenyl-3-methyl-5-hydroxy-6-metoxy-1,4-benzoquinol methylase